MCVLNVSYIALSLPAYLLLHQHQCLDCWRRYFNKEDERILRKLLNKVKKQSDQSDEPAAVTAGEGTVQACVDACRSLMIEPLTVLFIDL